MSKPIQLHIPEPCHAHWNEMAKTDKGRFCLSCQKQVVDFSIMSDQEILTYISKSKGNLCGHFYPDQLNRNISVKQAGKLGWFRYFIHVMIPAMIITNRAAAQETIRGEAVVCVSPSSNKSVGKLVVTEEIKKQYLLKGKVIDDLGQPVLYATVMIKGTRHGTATDTSGNFQIMVDRSGSIFLEVSQVGYETKESVINVSDNPQTALIRIQLKEVVMGGIATSVVIIAKKRDTSIFQKIRNMLVSPKKVNDKVIVYPNPAPAGSTINLAFDINKSSEFTVTMINVSRQPVLQKRMRIENGKQIEQLQCGAQLSKGIYTIRVINLSTKKIYNNNVLVL